MAAEPTSPMGGPVRVLHGSPTQEEIAAALAALLVLARRSTPAARAPVGAPVGPGVGPRGGSGPGAAARDADARRSAGWDRLGNGHRVARSWQS